MICEMCTKEFEKITWDGNGEPVTISMLDYLGKDKGSRLIEFCSMPCCSTWEELNPVSEDITGTAWWQSSLQIIG